MSLSPSLLFSQLPTQTGSVGLITLHRPSALNALNSDMIRGLTQQLQHWSRDREIHAVIITSDHEKAFCAGGDVRTIYDIGRSDPRTARAFFHEEYQLNYLISQYNKPFIALMNGITMGGGAGISLHGSHRVATDSFLFAMPETAIGFFPDVGASAFLNQTPGELGLYLGLTGARLNANDAYYAGLIDYHLRREDIADFLASLAYSDLRREARKEISLLLEGYHEPTQPSDLARKRQLIDTCFSADTVEDITVRLADSAEPFAHETMKLLQWLSPTSLGVTLQHLRSTRGMPLAESLQQDYQLACAFLAGEDFYEGVRAVLVDKDRTPHWAPCADIAGYFQRTTDAVIIK